MTENAAPKAKPFSMIREFHLADWFTLANAVCGVGAMFAIITFIQTGEVHHVYYACALVLAALIAYGVGMQGLWDRIILGYFVACGVSRLARFNVTAEAMSAGGDKVKHFEGTPIPTSMLLVALLWVAAGVGAIGAELWGGALKIAGFTLHPLVLLYALSGSLMISRIRIPKL